MGFKFEIIIHTYIHTYLYIDKMLFTLTNKINIQWHKVFGINSTFFGQEKIWQRLLHVYNSFKTSFTQHDISEVGGDSLFS